jgi:hypothetical protein
MKFTRLGSFTLGVVITAVSVAGVSYVNASTNKTIKACADKKSGVMRYITKGKCKKNERTLTWNQTGPQGIQGAQGPVGPQGERGLNAQNFHIIDAAGRDLGPAIDISSSGQTATFLHEGGIWTISQGGNFPSGAISFADYPFYLDSSCNDSLVYAISVHQPMRRGWNEDTFNPKYFKENGSPFLRSSRLIYGLIESGEEEDLTYTCTPSSDPNFNIYFRLRSDSHLVALTEVTPPSYTAPFTIVAK